VPAQPLAYFITFHTFGTWLHGQAPGSVDREHNAVGTPWLDADADRLAEARELMTQEIYLLDEPKREIVRDAIIAECSFRGWQLHALHVRSNHVHLVVTAERDPESVMRSCKSHSSKCLNKAGFDTPDRKRWTVHGSTKYLWNEAAVAEKVEYVLNGQGTPMARYPEAD